MAPSTGRHEKEQTMAKSIEFTASGSCSALGNFAPGTIARNIPDGLADHLVKEAMCAKYLAGPAAAPAAQPEEGHQPETVRRVRKPKAQAADETATP